MTEAERTEFLNRIEDECWEAALDKAIADCHREGADEDVDSAIYALEAVIDNIVAQPIRNARRRPAPRPRMAGAGQRRA